jgi:hypothetical protein
MGIYKVSQPIVRDNLSVYLDATNVKSYSGNTAVIWNDLSGNNITGTLVNVSGTTFSNGSIILDGANDYITLTLPSFGSNYSISFWIRFITLPGVSTEKQVFGSPGDIASISLFNSIANDYRFISWNGSIGRTGNTTLSTGTWYNFVMVNSSNTVFYLNGSIDGSFANTATLNSGAATIGAISGTRNLNCNINNVLFYNKALSQLEITQNFNSMRGRFRI